MSEEESTVVVYMCYCLSICHHNHKTQSTSSIVQLISLASSTVQSFDSLVKDTHLGSRCYNIFDLSIDHCLDWMRKHSRDWVKLGEEEYPRLLNRKVNKRPWMMDTRNGAGSHNFQTLISITVWMGQGWCQLFEIAQPGARCSPTLSLVLTTISLTWVDKQTLVKKRKKGVLPCPSSWRDRLTRCLHCVSRPYKRLCCRS